MEESNTEYYKIMVVEDEELILNHVVAKIHAVSDSFKVVATAMDGTTALERIKRYMPHILFTDIRIPQMDGLRLAEKVHEEFPLIYTVIFTGYADFKYAQRAIHSSVFEYLLKPVRAEDLSNVLARLTARINYDRAASLHNFEKTSGMTPKHTYELIKDFILYNYEKQIDLQSIASDLHYSPSYLTRIFKKYADKTPVRFLIEVRINTAAQLLLTTDLPISSVGEQVGYPNPYHFSRIFKQYMEMSPSEYREAK